MSNTQGLSSASRTECISAGRIQAVLHAGTAAVVTQRQRRGTGQAQTPIDALEQHHATATDDVAAIDRGLDNTPSNPSNPSKPGDPVGTLRRRQSSVAIGAEIPMATRSAMRLPTYAW